ncbi:LysR family transcriptional regulator [uncultured Tateyamaria sp.]|uniref:LysR family transcriptional regulator n=1 Tax=uncultured Tateyamaria sp. TaxID=455651 RepID=UPI00261B2D93|nr:LysR family transcriptional regulator [uncultured Tateyamaria sp.]
MRDAHWDDLRVFQVVADTGSFAGAAKALGQHETTVARRIRRLERQVSHVLWRGQNGGVTDEGAVLLNHVRTMTDAAQQADAALSPSQGPRGHVRLTVVPWLVEAAILPLWAQWRGEAPDLSLSVLGRHDSLSLMHGQADIALRFARPEAHGDVVIRKLCDVPFVLAGHGPDWVGYVPEMAHLPQAGWGPDSPNLRLSDQSGVTAAVHAGLGQAWLPRCVAGDLAQPGCAPRSRPLWVLTHPRTRKNASVVAIVSGLLPLVVRHLCS